MKKNKEKITVNYLKLIIFLFITTALILFFWFCIRPSIVRSKCHREAEKTATSDVVIRNRETDEIRTIKPEEITKYGLEIPDFKKYENGYQRCLHKYGLK